MRLTKPSWRFFYRFSTRFWWWILWPSNSLDSKIKKAGTLKRVPAFW
jgi:hypothetical protein